MADITMCIGVSGVGVWCARRVACYRHTARAGQYQSWMDAPDDMLEEIGCGLYIPAMWKPGEKLTNKTL